MDAATLTMAWNKLLTIVDDIDATAVRLERHGFPVTWDDAFPGYRRFYAADGNGNRVEVLAMRGEAS